MTMTRHHNVICMFLTVDEDDIFQCGKCKKQFTNFSAFVSHKQTPCTNIQNVLGLRSINNGFGTHVGSSAGTLKVGEYYDISI